LQELASAENTSLVKFIVVKYIPGNREVIPLQDVILATYLCSRNLVFVTSFHIERQVLFTGTEKRAGGYSDISVGRVL
jgi:hypothetical protein